MLKTTYEFEGFSTKTGFNRSLEHFKSVSGLLGEFENKENLADLINDLVTDGDMELRQVNATLYALLVDKYNYYYQSHNLETTMTDFSKIKEEVPKWKAVDIVLSYNHPELGITVINPKNPDHWDSLDQLKRDELIVIYVGGFNKEIDAKTAKTAIDKIIGLLNDKKLKTPAALLKGSFTYKPRKKKEPVEAEKPKTKKKTTSTKTKRTTGAAARPAEREEPAEEQRQPAPQARPQPSGKRRITPMYSIPVTNELFHNGNVEAWKKIIDSYTTKYPNNEVIIFYEGERINDINTLFKWGKVKHGSSILIAVAGDEIKDLAKLQRYLRQGASPQFEAFLRVPVNQILNLF